MIIYKRADFFQTQNIIPKIIFCVKYNQNILIIYLRCVHIKSSVVIRVSFPPRVQFGFELSSTV